MRWNSQAILVRPAAAGRKSIPVPTRRLISFMNCAMGLTFFDLFPKSMLPVGARVGLELILRSHRLPRQGDDNGTGICKFGVWFSAPPLWRSV